MTTRVSKPNFDRVARIYRWAEYLTLGPLLQQTRLAHLDKLQNSHEALLFGDGDGRFLARLLIRNPALRATAVDTSAAMLRLLSGRCIDTGANRLRAVQAPAQQAPIPPGTDLVVTHFFLDCLSQPEVDALAARIAASVQPGALWLVSDFAIPSSPLLRGPARLYIRTLYLAFRLLTGLRVTALPDPQAALAHAGFRCLARHEKLRGLLYSELWAYEPAENPNRAHRHNPPVPAFIHSSMASHDQESQQPAVSDPLPDPEPIAPSLEKPDPGVFHHEPATPQHSPAATQPN